MILIADSGSTTTQWRQLLGNQVLQAVTKGFNPYYQTSAELEEELRNSLLDKLQGDIVTVFFYGAGCNTPEYNEIVALGLKAVFPAADIYVHSDLLAAARALCGHEAGIACIMGTGSNSCYYDGREIVSNIPPWGTWLGDEGSGSVMGRELVISFLNDELPAELSTSFEARYPDLKDRVLSEVYTKPYPNRYLGQFSKFLFHHRKHPWIYDFIYENFQLFLKRKVLKYPESSSVPAHFSGSIAFYFNTILRQVGADMDLTVKNILESPISGLTLYHQSK